MKTAGGEGRGEHNNDYSEGEEVWRIIAKVQSNEKKRSWYRE